MNNPYVYIIQNKERTHWYVGMRSANECPANEDTGYWGSSTCLDELIEQTGKENWSKTVVAEFDDAKDAHEYEQHLIKSMWDLPGRVNKARNGYCDHDNPEFRAKHKAAMEEVWQDPEVKAKHQAGCKIGAKKRAEDPEYRANHKAGIDKRAQNQVWLANTTTANKKKAKPFIATCIKTGEEFYCESGLCDQAKALKLDSGNVSSCLNGKREQHKGFTFRYV